MKTRNIEVDMQPELQDLLQKNATYPLLGDRRKSLKLIPSQKNKEKSAAADPEPADVVSTVIGNYGKWQLLMTFLLAMFSFPCTFHIYLPTFTAKSTKFWCRMPDSLAGLPIDKWINYSQPVDACYVRELPDGITVESILNNTAPILDTFLKCQQWDYDRSEVGETIISEWNLVCDNAGLTNLAEVVFLIGVGIGGVVGGWISDKFGRKRILMGMMILQCVLAIISLLVRSYIQYVAVRLVMGLVSVSVVYAAFVLSVELVSGNWVTIAGVCNFFPLPLAYIIVSLLSLLLPNWRDLQLSLSLPGCFLLLLWFVLPESPRWLIGRGRIQEAKEIIVKAAKFNNRTIPDDLDKMLLLSKPETEAEQPSLFMLFKGVLLKRTFCLFIAWFSMTIAYYGLLLNIGNFNLGNLHVTSIILAVVEIPAIAVSIPILMVGKFAIGSSNMMMPIFTAELYPTLIRNLGVGVSQVAAGLALMCIPYLWELTALNKHLPMVTIAALSALGGGIVLLLPETTRTIENKKPAYDNSSPCNGTFTICDERGYQN
ncbi:PREDICTED: solute carrier family 22 member 4-like [Papilio polytes]|uniref:solute carrier family 22 member 4-like n=1 Tax=Papilio polytes TaxID=76194 RepID=UPI00067666F1|nr:PREDICTED: solute carrier family 22 member 4-like [Papilio polytes]